jgi:hypothetical protein
MTDAERCFVGECDRRSAASVTRHDLPGPLRLCATHTEQFRQSSESWGITWPPGQTAPTLVTAPGSDVLWAYKPNPGNGPEPRPRGGTAGAHDPGRRGLLGFSSRAAGWFEARRGGRGPK